MPVTYSKRDSIKTARRHPPGRDIGTSLSASNASNASLSDHALDQTNSQRRGNASHPLRSDYAHEEQDPGLAPVQ